jgi:DNA-binding SARP family transcriptional activator
MNYPGQRVIARFTVDVRILGPLEILSGSRPIDLAQPAPRQVLTVLLLDAGRRVPRGRLIEALWGDEPPGDPDAALRSRISAARRALADSSDRLETVHGGQSGYRFQLTPGELDATRFLNLADSGRAAFDEGDLPAAARLLQQAGDLWHDPPLPDLPPTALMRAEAARLDRARVDAQDRLAEARLALGDHHDLVGQLELTLAAHPLRERTWRQLMVALYRSGQRAEALQAYRRARVVMVRELGIEPGPELRRLHRQLLNDDPDLAPGHSRPATIGLPRGASSWAPVWQLPAAPCDFTGRAAELDLVRCCLLRPGVPVVVITGPAGVGKTTLAVQAGHLTRAHFPDGQLYVRFTGQPERDPQDALAELMRGLGVPGTRVPQPGPEREALYRAVLARRRMLIVADGCLTAAQIRPLLPGTEGSAILVTSCSGLPDLEAAQPIQLRELSPADALAMVCRVAGHAKSAAAPEAMAEIAGLCGRLPLLLRIAGARLAYEPSLTPGALARMLAKASQRLETLTIGELSAQGRLDAAYEQLSRPAQRALRCSSLQPSDDLPGWLLPVLAADSDAADVVAELSRAGLITVAAAPGEATERVRLPALSRYLASERLASESAADVTVASLRLANAWLELADVASRHVDLDPLVAPLAALPLRSTTAAAAEVITDPAVTRFGRENDSLLGLARAACADGDHALAMAIAERQYSVQTGTGEVAAAHRQWHLISQTARRAGDTLAIAQARYKLAALAISYGDMRVGGIRAIHVLDRCLRAFVTAGDDQAIADTHHLIAVCAIADDDPARARRNAERGLAVATSIADLRAVFLNASALGIVLAGLGLAAGLSRCDEAVATAADLDQPRYLQFAGHARNRAAALLDQPAALRPWQSELAP